MAHVLVVVARRYNGHELWGALTVLQSRGHTFELVSTDTTLANEVTYEHNRIEKTFDDVPSVDPFDALMFISGNMDDTELYWHHPKALEYVDQAHERQIPLAAICCSVPTIRKAAKGRRVSYFPLIRSRKLLEGEGAILQNVSISVDGPLVTAEHQMATEMWAEAFCEVLEGNDPDLGLEDSGYTPKGRERKPDPDLQRLRKIVKRTGRTNVKKEE